MYMVTYFFFRQGGKETEKSERYSLCRRFQSTVQETKSHCNGGTLGGGRTCKTRLKTILGIFTSVCQKL